MQRKRQSVTKIGYMMTDVSAKFLHAVSNVTTVVAHEGSLSQFHAVSHDTQRWLEVKLEKPSLELTRTTYIFLR